MIIKNSKGYIKFSVFLGQVKFSLDKYIIAICLSLGNYQILLIPHP